MQQLADELVELVLYTGSVRAAHREIEQVLLATGDDGLVYPNRLYTVLSAEPRRGINTSTMEALKRALSGLDVPASGGERDRVRAEILNAFGAFGALGADGSTDLRKVADQCGYPPAVVQYVIRSNHGTAPIESLTESLTGNPKLTVADWSFQDVAVRSTLEALRKSVDRKIGLIVPTGGGKTRIAMLIGLACLRESQREDGVVLWVTHRLRLRRQARRELQRLLSAGTIQVGSDSISLFERRFIFVMVNDLENALREYGNRSALVVVDEAHHAAAPSYRPLFEVHPLRGLFLTATPNRADALSIGIDEIAFSITYRELIRYGALVEPTFDSPLAIEELDWTQGTGLEDLADYLLDRSETEIKKLLVAVSRKAHAERLYRVLQKQLHLRVDHTLTDEDLGFVHAEATSTDAEPEEFLDEFVARPRGILVATSQLIGEGFDDPGIDGVVITYPSESIGHLMQVAGRALRVSHEKTTAHIVQVHASKMSYYFEQRWLYQDISDRLRPQLADYTYSTEHGLKSVILLLLQQHGVSTEIVERIRQELHQVAIGGRYSLLLTGLPYYGNKLMLEGRWGAILASPKNRTDFVQIYNLCSDRGAGTNAPQEFIKNYFTPDPTKGSLWKSYVDLLCAMEYALKELRNTPYEGEHGRDYLPRRGTSWLKYITFDYSPILPEALSSFLLDAVNRDEVAANFTAEPNRWYQAVKIPLPLSGSVAFLLDQEQSNWLTIQRKKLADQLHQIAGAEGFNEIRRWHSRLDSSPLPLLLLEHIDDFISDIRLKMYSLALVL